MSRTGSGDARIALVASWVVVAVLVFQGTLSMATQVTDDLTPVSRVVGVLSVVASAALFVRAQFRAMRRAPVPRLWVWLTVLVATAGFVIGAWLTPGFALGALAVTLTGRVLVWVSSTYLVLLALFFLAQGIHPLNSAAYLLVICAVTVMLYVLTRLAVTVSELEAARETVARLRVDEERHRISRDLHDILGRSLVAVSLRVQTAMRLLDRDPERCGEQLEEIAKMVSDGQGQLRGLTRGAQVTGLAEEVQSAQELFCRLGIRCDVDLDDQVTPAGTVDELGARVVRECVTNLLKHSRPSGVEISLRQESATSVLVVLNDGVRDARASRGTGLADLAARVEASGGTMEAGHLVRDRFRVIVRLPHQVPAPDDAPAPDAPLVVDLPADDVRVADLPTADLPAASREVTR